MGREGRLSACQHISMHLQQGSRNILEMSPKYAANSFSDNAFFDLTVHTETEKYCFVSPPRDLAPRSCACCLALPRDGDARRAYA
eukprot:2359938-Pleurochrysis_carterae.AAC.1